MGLFKKRPYISLKQNSIEVVESEKAPMIPDGKWIQCPQCQKTVYLDDIGEFQICPNCDYHFRLTPKQRISIMTDEFEEWFVNEQMKVAVDFPGYDLKQKKARQTTGEEEAVTVGLAKISHLPFVLAIMNPYFMMGSMGQVVGEKLTLAFEEATKRKLPIIVCTASGGARMQEGILSLMQMAKTSGAVKRLNEKMNSLLSKHQWIERLNIYLLTFPLDNKREFVSSLHQKLKGAQQI